MKLHQLPEEEEAGRHGAALQQRGQHQLERVGQDVLLHGGNALWVHVHDGAEQGEHQLGDVQVVVADEHGQLVQHGLVECCCDCGHGAGGSAAARADERVLAVDLEDGVQAEEGGQPQVAVVLAQEARQQWDCFILRVG